MKNTNTEPLIIVTNPNSTKASLVESEVLAPLRANGVDFIQERTRYERAEDNVNDLIDRLPERARVLSAAGDGTAEQLGNVALKGKKELTLGILPYGNYNDTAHAHMRHGQDIFSFLGDNAPTVERTPLEVDINGEELTDTFSYATFGLTAIIAAGFRDKASRDRLQQAGPLKRMALRYGQAGRDYLKFASTKLPDFRVDDGEVQRNRTDLAFANNPSVAGMLRFGDTFYDTPQFGARTDLDMATFKDLMTFGLPAVFAMAPLERAEAMRIRFEKTAESIEFQSGGEYQDLKDVDEIFVFKDPSKKVTYLHPKALPRT